MTKCFHGGVPVPSIPESGASHSAAAGTDLAGTAMRVRQLAHAITIAPSQYGCWNESSHGRSHSMKILRNLVLLLLVVTLSGCGYNAIQRQDEAVKGAWSEVLKPVPASRRPGAEPGQHGQGLRPARRKSLRRSDRGARQGRQPAGQRRYAQRSAEAAAVPGCAGPVGQRAFAVDGGQRELSAVEGRRPVQNRRRNWKAPRTALPSRAIAMCRRCRITTR